MSLVVSINKPKVVSAWREYKDDESKAVVNFKIRGIAYKPYQIAVERARNQVVSKGFNVESVSENDKPFDELLLDCCACYLIEDWQNLAVITGYDENDKPIISNLDYSIENAKTLLSDSGDIGLIIWDFIKTQSEKIQEEADSYKNELLGKLKVSTSGQDTETTKPQVQD